MKRMLFVLFFSGLCLFIVGYKSSLPANVQKRVAERREKIIAQSPVEQKEKKQSTDFLIVVTGIVLLLLFFIMGAAYLNFDEKYIKKINYDGDGCGGLE